MNDPHRALVSFEFRKGKGELQEIHAARDQPDPIRRDIELVDHSPADGVRRHDHAFAPPHDNTHQMSGIVSMTGRNKGNAGLARRKPSEPGRNAATGVNDIHALPLDDLHKFFDQKEARQGFLMHGQTVMRDPDLLEFGHKGSSGRNDEGRMSFFFHGSCQIHDPALSPAELQGRQKLHHFHIKPPNFSISASFSR